MNNILRIERIVSSGELLPLVPERDRACAATMSNERRRAEWLMWRSVVYRYLPGVEIGYDAIGAPVIRDRAVWLSVSHCSDYVAVALADGPCAVDIEPVSRDFMRAAPRFVTDRERSLGDSPLLLPALWCGKEALYKYAGRRGLDFRSDLWIERFDPTDPRMTGRICGGDPVGIDWRVEEGIFVASIF